MHFLANLRFVCGWHFVWTNFWLALCLDHLNMFWHFVRIMEFNFIITTLSLYPLFVFMGEKVE